MKYPSMYDSPGEIRLTRATEEIKIAQRLFQNQKSELAKKDQTIEKLHKRIVELQENIDSRKRIEKENLDLQSSLNEEISSLRQELHTANDLINLQETQIQQLIGDNIQLENEKVFLENEKDKANHIIKTFIKKLEHGSDRRLTAPIR